MKIMNNMEKPHFFDKNQTLTTKFDIFGKVNFFCTCVVKVIFKMQMYLVHQLLNCICVHRKTRPSLSHFKNKTN